MRSSWLWMKEEVGQRLKETVKSVTNEKAISNEKIKQRQKMQPLGKSFLAVKDYEEFTDMDDELYVYKVDENEQIIFKTSSFKMRLAKPVNSENEEELPSEFFFRWKSETHKRLYNSNGKLLEFFFTKTSAASGNGVYKRK